MRTDSSQSQPPDPSKVRSCVVCAWRETCQKKFGGGPEIAVHCVDFTFDVRLNAPRPASSGNEEGR